MPTKVMFAALQQAQEDVHAAAARLNQQLDDLKAHLAPLIGSWDGEAAAQYRARQAEWDQAAANLNQILMRVGSAVGTALSNFQATERTNASIWG